MAFSVQHVHLKTPDPHKTAQFYVDNFGATLKADIPGRGVQVDLHGLQLNITTLITVQNHEQHYGIEHMAVDTDDYAGTLATLRKQRRAHPRGAAAQQRPSRRLRGMPGRRADGDHREDVAVSLMTQRSNSYGRRTTRCRLVHHSFVSSAPLLCRSRLLIPTKQILRSGT